MHVEIHNEKINACHNLFIVLFILKSFLLLHRVEVEMNRTVPELALKTKGFLSLSLLNKGDNVLFRCAILLAFLLYFFQQRSLLPKKPYIDPSGHRGINR